MLGLILGPVAIVCGWLGMGRTWSSRPITAVIAFALGIIDTLLAIMWLAGPATPGQGFW